MSRNQFPQNPRPYGGQGSYPPQDNWQQQQEYAGRNGRGYPQEDYSYNNQNGWNGYASQQDWQGHRDGTNGERPAQQPYRQDANGYDGPQGHGHYQDQGRVYKYDERYRTGGGSHPPQTGGHPNGNTPGNGGERNPTQSDARKANKRKTWGFSLC